MSELAVRTAVPTVDVARLLGAPRAVVVDLRSPSEFAVDHVPGAVNVPLFDDVERAVIGALYGRSSPERAFEVGRQITRRRIGDLVAGIAAVAGWKVRATDLEERVELRTAGGIARLEGELVPRPVDRLGQEAVVLACWRGGLRSRSVVSFVRELGLDRAVALEGGYKAWRRHVAHDLALWRPPGVFVLRGWTGVGKTIILRELERLHPGWTIDLEAMAGHRSSILGMVGLEPCSQKAFETRLFMRLRRGFEGPCVVEGESRKVGDVILPQPVWNALDGGVNILLQAPLERRIDVLVEDYLAREENRAELFERLPFIEGRLGPCKWRGELVALLEARRERELVRILLERYYDPLYRHSERGRSYCVAVDATDPARAAAEIADWIDGRRRIAGGSDPRAEGS